MVLLVRLADAKVVKSGQTEAPGIIVVVGGLSAGCSLLQLVSTCVCGADKFWCYVNKILDAFGHSYWRLDVFVFHLKLCF